jgi:hypothetical protein
MTRLKRVSRWIASHKLLTLLLVILVFVLIQAATIPWLGVPRLRDQIPKETALMRQRIDEAEAKGKTLLIRQSWVPLSRLPKYLTDAIIVAEDGTFYEHDGFDWFEVRESLEKNIKERRAARGGSTITQQLAKNLYLSTSKDPLRKAREMVITMPGAEPEQATHPRALRESDRMGGRDLRGGCGGTAVFREAGTGALARAIPAPGGGHPEPAPSPAGRGQPVRAAAFGHHPKADAEPAVCPVPCGRGRRRAYRG